MLFFFPVLTYVTILGRLVCLRCFSLNACPSFDFHSCDMDNVLILVLHEILQVREISLLRESNMQLREENRHNFEECQVWLDNLLFGGSVV